MMWSQHNEVQMYLDLTYGPVVVKPRCIGAQNLHYFIFPVVSTDGCKIERLRAANKENSKTRRNDYWGPSNRIKGEFCLQNTNENTQNTRLPTHLS